MHPAIEARRKRPQPIEGFDGLYARRLSIAEVFAIRDIEKTEEKVIATVEAVVVDGMGAAVFGPGEASGEQDHIIEALMAGINKLGDELSEESVLTAEKN